MSTGYNDSCLVCEHPDHQEINEELASGASIPFIGIRHKLSVSTLTRHKRAHLIVADSAQGMQVISLRDVVSIPLQMRERNELIKALIEALIEPLTRNGRFSGIKHVQLNQLIGLLKIQQIDEQTILKITGMMNDEGMRGDAVMTQQYADIRLAIEDRLMLLSGGNDNAAIEARRILAEELVPMAEIDPTYIDLPMED